MAKRAGDPVPALPELSLKLLLAVHTAVDPVFLIRQLKAVRELLFDRSDAARIFALDDIRHHVGKPERALFYDLVIFDHIDGDIFIEDAEDVEVHGERPLDLDNILFSHFITSRVFDDRDAAVEFF